MQIARARGDGHRARSRSASLEMYGAEPGKASFANNCLLARRLVERGVRFVQLFDWGWDIHGTGKDDDIVDRPAEQVPGDRPARSRALLTDLKQRGLLDDTLVVWGGEFGRTPMNEARGGSKFLGRDHHPHCFTIWMAGGGIKRGHDARRDRRPRLLRSPRTRSSVHDLQATILHLLGLDPYKLSYKYQGLNARLIGPTDTPKSARKFSSDTNRSTPIRLSIGITQVSPPVVQRRVVSLFGQSSCVQLLQVGSQNTV